MQFFTLITFAIIGFLINLLGFHAEKDWQFWAIIGMTAFSYFVGYFRAILVFRKEK